MRSKLVLILFILSSLTALSQTLDPRDELGSKLLDAAKSKNTADIVKLIKAGADVNYTANPEGPSALSYAAYNCDLDSIQRLIAYKANVNYATCSQGIRCQLNSTPLVYALAGSINTPALCSEAVSLLMDAKANVAYKSIFTNRTAVEIYSTSAIVEIGIYKKVATATLASSELSASEKQLILNESLRHVAFFSHTPSVVDYLLTVGASAKTVSSDDTDLLKLTMISSGVSASATKDIVEILNLLVKKGGLKAEEKHLIYSLDASFPEFVLAEVQALLSLGAQASENVLARALSFYYFNQSFSSHADDQKFAGAVITLIMNKISDLDINTFIYSNFQSHLTYMKTNVTGLELLIKHNSFNPNSEAAQKTLCYLTSAGLTDAASVLKKAGVSCVTNTY